MKYKFQWLLFLLLLPPGLFYKPIIHTMWHFTIFLRAVDKDLAYINALFPPGITEEEGPLRGLGYVWENAFLIRIHERKDHITQGKIQGKIRISVEKVRYPSLLKIT